MKELLLLLIFSFVFSVTLFGLGILFLIKIGVIKTKKNNEAEENNGHES